MSRSGGARVVDALPDVVSAIFEKIASVAGIALAVTLAYLIYGLFTNAVRGYPALSAAAKTKVLTNLGVASNIFTVAAVVLLIYVAIRLWEHEGIPAILGFLGAAFYFGTPFALVQILGVWTNPASAVIQGTLTNVGELLLAAAVARGVVALVSRLRVGPRESEEKTASRKAPAKGSPGFVHPLSPCWRLPFCRAYIRHNCIRYKERTTCWRKKTGCMCDEDIIAAALMGGEGSSSSAREKLILEFLPGAGGKRASGRRVTCEGCFIYLEHQRIKYKYIAPLALPVVIGLFWRFLTPIETVYGRFGQWATATVQSIALEPVKTDVVLRTFTNPMVKWLVFLALGMFALTQMLRFLEFLLFKLKI